MKFSNIINNASTAFNKVGFKIKKNSPEILVVSGIVGMVGAAVMACKATPKIDTIKEEHKEVMDKIHETVELQLDSYDENDAKKDTAIVYLNTGFKYVKLYAPSVILGTASIAAILSGNNILRKRNVALAAAYTAIDKSFKEYRNRVAERFGSEIEKEIRYNVKAEKIESKIKDEKTGKSKKVKEEIKSIDGLSDYSDYAKVYDDGCTGWTKDPELNLMFLKRQQEYANERLMAKGHLFLNEVYDMLGIPRTTAGQVVGWIYDEKNPIGDNYVDFGMYNTNISKNRDFINGYERTIILDFNVDGPILNNIWMAGLHTSYSGLSYRDIYDYTNIF